MMNFFFFVFTAWFLFPVRVEALLLMLKLMLFFVLCLGNRRLAHPIRAHHIS